MFGWRFTQWGDGHRRGMVLRVGDRPAPGQAVNAFVVTVDVADCAAHVDQAVAAGTTIALPRAATPGVGRLAYVTDPDGNLLGLCRQTRPRPEALEQVA